MCVRTCDGYYFPISYAASSARFAQDEKTCQRLCPASEAMLFSYRTTGEDITQATSIGGQPYTALPKAPPATAAPATAAPAGTPPPAAAEAEPGKRPVRSVGPTFIPPRTP